MIIRFLVYKLVPFSLMVAVAMATIMFRPAGWYWILCGNFTLYALYRYLSRIESYLSHEKRELELFTEENPGRLTLIKLVTAIFLFLGLYFLVQPRLPSPAKEKEEKLALQLKEWEGRFREMERKGEDAKAEDVRFQGRMMENLGWIMEWRQQEAVREEERKKRFREPPIVPSDETLRSPEVIPPKGESASSLPAEERQRQLMEKEYFLDEEKKESGGFEVKVIKKGDNPDTNSNDKGSGTP